MKVRACLFALATVVGLSSAAGAQQLTPVDSNTVAADSSVARGAVASSIDRPSEAVRRNALAAPLPMAQTMGLGRAKAMMAVGAAAFITGILIGDDVGTVFMVGGAGIGLYGLWQYLQ